jgi:hypothetical protein
LLDARMFDFVGLKPTGQPDVDGDHAFDPDSFAAVPPVNWQLPVAAIVQAEPTARSLPIAPRPT